MRYRGTTGPPGPTAAPATPEGTTPFAGPPTE